MTHYEMAEKLSEKMGVSLEKATAALEACDCVIGAPRMLEAASFCGKPAFAEYLPEKENISGEEFQQILAKSEEERITLLDDGKSDAQKPAEAENEAM